MSRYARAFSAEAESNKPQGSFLKKALADAVSAYTAGAMCTPFIATLDRAVTENASGRNTIYGSATSSFREILKSPLTFLKAPAFRWVLFVYGTTYCTNNLFDTYSSHFRRDVAMEKWLGASAINSTASMLKDRAFAALFGATAVPGTVPLGSYLAWGSRDLMSMAFFVSLPPLVGHELAKHTGNERLSYYAAQFMMPLLLQFVTSPIHLLGFDFYNNRNASVRARVGSMLKHRHASGLHAASALMSPRVLVPP